MRDQRQGHLFENLCPILPFRASFSAQPPQDSGLSTGAALGLYIPCRTLKDQAPLKAHPAAKHSGKYYSPLTEELLFDVEKIYAYLAHCKPWYRTVTDNRTVALGSQQYFLKDSKPGTELDIRFDLATKQLVFCNENQGLIAQLPSKGLEYKDLAGDIGGFVSWVNALVCIEHARPDPDTTFLHNP